MDVLDEAARIKKRLMECQTGADVEAVANDERETVRAMAEQSQDGKTMAIQISNLKQYRLWVLSREK